jgi:hypothetical protein
VNRWRYSSRSSSIEGFGLGLIGPSALPASACASAFALRGTHCDLDVGELLDQQNRLLMQRLEVLRPDFPLAVQLIDKQSGIEAHAQVSNPASVCGLETSDESSVLRDVIVLRWPDWLRDLLEGSLQDHANRGLTCHLAGLIGDYAGVGRE